MLSPNRWITVDHLEKEKEKWTIIGNGHHQQMSTHSGAHGCWFCFAGVCGCEHTEEAMQCIVQNPYTNGMKRI